jgi:hypothetical protein
MRCDVMVTADGLTTCVDKKMDEGVAKRPPNQPPTMGSAGGNQQKQRKTNIPWGWMSAVSCRLSAWLAGWRSSGVQL